MSVYYIFDHKEEIFLMYIGRILRSLLHLRDKFENGRLIFAVI